MYEERAIEQRGRARFDTNSLSSQSDDSHDGDPRPTKSRKRRIRECFHKKSKDRKHDGRRSRSDDTGSPSPQRQRGGTSNSRSRSPIITKRERSVSPVESSRSSSKAELGALSTKELKILRDQIEFARKKEAEKLDRKINETYEEKRARRIAKKEKKEIRRKQEMGWDSEYLGYTNEDNPFGDEKLLDTFVWDKKLQKEGCANLDMGDLNRLQKQRMLANKQELELVKQRRIEREREMDQRELDKELAARAQEGEFFREWAKNEDTFHLQQAKLRSRIRIDDGRAKPIDLLAHYIAVGEGRETHDDLSIEMHVSYKYLDGLEMEDLEDLLEDIKVYQELHKENTDYQQYWNDIRLVSGDELKKLQRAINQDVEVRERREGINKSVHSDVTKIFDGKSSSQLAILRKEIERKLKGGPGVDIAYWESLLGQLDAHTARTRLDERHAIVLRERLHKLRSEQAIDEPALFPSGGDSTATSASSPVVAGVVDEPAPSASTAMPSPDAVSAPPDDTITSPGMDDGDDDEDDDGLKRARLVEQYRQGRYSPKLLGKDDIEYDWIIYNPRDDIKKLEYQRHAVRKTGTTRLDSEAEFMKQAAQSMDDAASGGADAQFSVEVPIEQTFLWSDKYKPRKPRYFNRVHTGYEWNKYNQTHYDVENPPPKIVQGYKFNIYYPDLIDKTKPPSFELIPEPDTSDFVMIRFKAGPPYEDIAFRIVHREWNTRHYKGFRCQFHNGIFQLWFHFEKYRYRK